MEVISRLKERLPENAKLTRYIDIHSFLYFITQNKLRFARLDTFEDLNEGFSVHTAEAVKGITDRSRSIKDLSDKEEMLQSVAELKQQYAELEQRYKYHQQDLFASCWYMGERESVAMWNLYSNANSVAIRFNANQLIDILTNITSKHEQDDGSLLYGTVEYADLSASDKALNRDCVGFLKDDSFRHEQEFRFMTRQKAAADVLEYEVTIDDLKQIDFSIISHPKMEEWKIRNILNVLCCYELTQKFQPSELALKSL